jgi:hypothetical protein
MVSRSDTFLTSSGPIVSNRQIRPTRVAILHGSKIPDYNISQDQIHSTLAQIFLPLNARIFSVLEMTQAGISDLISSQAYDVVCLIGEAQEFDFSRRKSNPSSSRLRLGNIGGGGAEGEIQRIDANSLILAFAPNAYFRDVKSYLRISDAVVLCDVVAKNWLLQVAEVVYRFLESLVVPSMLNIDLADVKHIAKGIGLAFNLSDDSSKKLINRLPKSCLVARSALLHFSCDPDVRLKEVYSVSKAIALKKGITDLDTQINTHSDAKKVIRKVNVKMGIRINEAIRKDAVSPSSRLGQNETGIEQEDDDDSRKRISLTAILFGL